MLSSLAGVESGELLFNSTPVESPLRLATTTSGVAGESAIGAIRVDPCSSVASLCLAFGLEQMSTRPEVTEYLVHLEKERDVSPHTVKAYARDLEDFTEFCDRHYGDWTWATVDRLGMRGFLGELKRRGLATTQRGPLAVGGAELLPLSPGAPRRGQQHRPRGEDAQAGEAASHLPGSGSRPTASSRGPSRGPAETSSGRRGTSPSWSCSIRPASGCRSSAA